MTTTLESLRLFVRETLADVLGEPARADAGPEDRDAQRLRQPDRGQVSTDQGGLRSRSETKTHLALPGDGEAPAKA